MTQETSIQVRVKALRDAAAAVCQDCKRGYDLEKQGAVGWVHIWIDTTSQSKLWPMVNLCNAAAIHDLIEQAEAEGREAGERKDELLILLRDLCGEFGDNDWPDELNRADALEKHFLKYIWQAQLNAVNENHAAAIEWLKGNSMAEIEAERIKAGIEAVGPKYLSF